MRCLNEAEIGQLAGNAAAIKSAEALTAAALELVAAAVRLGLVLTVEQQPLVPLAMGHHETVVSVRQARSMA